MGNIDAVRRYFDQTDSYIKTNPIIPLRKKIVKELIGEIKGKRILDVGCGNGELTKDFIPENSVTFLDISGKMLELARLNISAKDLLHASFINTDIFNLEKGQSFDLIICVGIISHIDDTAKFLIKLKEIVAENGIIVLQFTDSEKLISKFNAIRYSIFNRGNYNYKITKVSSSTIESLLITAGLSIIKEMKYLPLSPLFSFFSYQKKLQFLEASYRKNFLHFLGSEIILVCKNRF